MKSMIATLLFAFHALANAGMPADIVLWTVATVPGKVTTSGAEIHLTGDIDARIASTVVDLIARRGYDTLKIQSETGSEVAARVIGASVFDHQMTVVVTGACSSSCARYIFTAAKHKRIETDVFVMFSEYKNYYDYVQSLQQLSEKRRLSGASALSDREKRTLSIGERWLSADSDYFTKIGVDKRIASFGYGADKPASYSVLSTTRMAEFGVSNVTASDGYGSEAYCHKMKIAGFLRFDAQCL